MSINPLLFLFLFLLHFFAIEGHLHLLNKRQTFQYPENLREFAQNYHPGTRVIHGTLGRFAPQEWPGWYTRTIFKWNGESRMSPYSPNDIHYQGWRLQRIANGGS